METAWQICIILWTHRVPFFPLIMQFGHHGQYVFEEGCTRSLPQALFFFCGSISSARRSCMRKDAQSLGSISSNNKFLQWPRIIQYLGRLRDSLARGTDSTLFRSPWIANLSSLVPTWSFWRLLTKMWWGSLTPPYLAISPSTQRGYASLLILHPQASAQ